MIPSQNPDGQHLVIDHWYKTKGTAYTRTYPDMYHKYVGHDDNRDWFMFTQKETRATYFNLATRRLNPGTLIDSRLDEINNRRSIQ